MDAKRYLPDAPQKNALNRSYGVLCASNEVISWQWLGDDLGHTHNYLLYWINYPT